MDDLDFCRRRVVEYAATRGKPGFDQQKLHDMVNGCALRQELLRTDLKLDEVIALQRLIGEERTDRVEICDLVMQLEVTAGEGFEGDAIGRIQVAIGGKIG